MSQHSLLPLLLLCGLRGTLGTRPVHDMEHNGLIHAADGSVDQDIGFDIEDVQVVDGVEEELDFVPPIHDDVAERFIAHPSHTEHGADGGSAKLPPTFFQLADEKVVEKHSAFHDQKAEEAEAFSEAQEAVEFVAEAVDSVGSMIGNYSAGISEERATAWESRLADWRDYLADQVATQVRRLSSFKMRWTEQGSKQEEDAQVEQRRHKQGDAGSSILLFFATAFRHWVVLLPIMVVGLILVVVPSTCIRHGREQEDKVKEEMVKKAKARFHFFEMTLHSRWLHPWGRGPGTDRQAPPWVQHRGFSRSAS